MKYSELFGEDIRADIAAIKRELDMDSSTVFVYSGPGTLYDYITDLNARGRGLDDEYLYRFKVCYEKKNLYVTYCRDRTYNKLIGSMSELIGELDSGSSCRIIVEADDWVELADIMQQLIYLAYPLETVDILLRREERDADKTKRFMDRVGELMDGCDTAVSELTSLRQRVQRESGPTRDVRLKDIEEALESCQAIQEQIADALNVELKFAVAASKKAGKSVIVNCFLGEEIAPASTELATPNNCIYRKSSDSRYSIQLEGDEVLHYYKTREEIHSAIQQYFREAQNSRETGFALPDMHIQYVTGENNFSAYTIFDTAGPDAAGTDHERLAREAMQKCDVAVFAIDYSKFLTKSEEAYLREVKQIFTAQDKFHSLLFALNKIDVRYTDEDSPKSFIMSVDFIKTRLADIDEAYRDCIIFPTSSKEYFNAVEAEKAGIAELKDGIAVSQMRDLTFARRDVPALKWLHGHSEYLDYYHGLHKISYDVFKKDSGMPALMNYVSYVARSKTRDELVNNVAAQIAIQKVKIQGVLDFIANLEALIHADDEKIKHISRIITDYTESVEAIFTQNCNKNDLAVLEHNNMLSQFDGVYEKMIDFQEETLKASCEETVVADNIYNVVVEVIWNRLSDKLQRDGEVTGRDINALFTARDFNTVVNSVIKVEAGRNADEIYGRLSQLRQEMERIAEYRQAQLVEANKKCRDALSKEDMEMKLPDPPAFEFATKMVPPEEVPLDVYQANLNLFHDLGFLFEKRFFANIGIWLSGILRFGKVSEEDYKRTLRGGIADFQIACDKYLRSDIVNAVYTYRIADKIYKPLKSAVVDKYLCGLVEELRQIFNTMNETYKACGAQFRAAVDDRDHYKADIALQEKRKETIQSIEEAAAGFMETWSQIVSSLADDIEPAV